MWIHSVSVWFPALCYQGCILIILTKCAKKLKLKVIYTSFMNTTLLKMNWVWIVVMRVFLKSISKESAEVYYADITWVAIDLCKKNEYHGLKDTFVEANSETLIFPDNYFDCVCSMDVLQHTLYTHKALAEIHWILKFMRN